MKRLPLIGKLASGLHEVSTLQHLGVHQLPTWYTNRSRRKTLRNTKEEDSHHHERIGKQELLENCRNTDTSHRTHSQQSLRTPTIEFDTPADQSLVLYLL